MFDPIHYIEAAYLWLIKQRAHHSPHADIWQLRANWHTWRNEIIESVRCGDYTLSAVRYYHINNELIGVWSASDALVLKMLALHLSETLSDVVSDRVYHIKGTPQKKRGIAAAVDHVRRTLDRTTYKYVMRSDIKSYYASIDHNILYHQCTQHISDLRILRWIKQYMAYHIYDDGIYRTNKVGISLGSPLSPLMAALYLRPLDISMSERSVFYIRYMDDWIILAKSRWSLRRAVAKCNLILDTLKVAQHPDKTYIGKITKGFDFLGVQFDTSVPPAVSPPTVPLQIPTTASPPVITTSVSLRSITKHLSKIYWLYEQGATNRRISLYRKRWIIYQQSLGLYPERSFHLAVDSTA